MLYAEEDRFRLLARNMTDVITRHGKNGAVLFVSPAAEPLLGAKVQELIESAHGWMTSMEKSSIVLRPVWRRGAGSV